MINTSEHEARLKLCQELVNTDASLINTVVTQDVMNTYSILGFILHTLNLSCRQDLENICNMASDVLNKGADPNLLAYIETDSSHPYYTNYEMAVMLSYVCNEGEHLDALLSKLRQCGGRVSRILFERWDHQMHQHLYSKRIAIADATSD